MNNNGKITAHGTLCYKEKITLKIEQNFKTCKIKMRPNLEMEKCELTKNISKMTKKITTIK